MIHEFIVYTFYHEVYTMTEKRRIYQTGNKHYKSLVCTIPAFYRHIFDLDQGDVLDWNLENVKGEWCIVIRSEKIKNKFGGIR